MKKQLLAVLIGTAGLLVGSQAFAYCPPCHIKTNGTQLNGLPTPGPVFQGTQVNGVPTPGPVFQGIQAEGFFSHNLQNRGAFFQANYLMPATQQAPAWSALPVSRMVVHVAPAI